MSKHMLDLQNEFDGAMRALVGLRDLAYEAQAPGKQQYNVLCPDSMAELVSMVEERFARAGKLLEATADEVFGR